MYIGLSILTIFILLFLLSESIRKQFKFLLVPSLILSGICLGYYAITGNPPTQILSDINDYFSDPHITDEASHRYYKDPMTHQ